MGRAQDTDQALVIHRVAPKEWEVPHARQHTTATGGLPTQARAWAQETNERTLPSLARNARKKSERRRSASKMSSWSTQGEQRIAHLEETVRTLQERLDKLLPPVPPVPMVPPNDWITRTNAWLREHKHEYRGRWVALRGGALLGADKSRVALHRRLEQSGELTGAAFARL